MKKRRFLALFSGLLMMSGLIACGKTETKSNLITFYHYGTVSSLNTEFTAKIKEFEKESGYSVKRVPITKDNFNSTIQTRLTSKKNDIDLLYLDQPLLAQYAKSGNIISLDEYYTTTTTDQEVVEVDGKKKFNTNAFYNSALETTKYNGSYYAVPLTLNTSVLYYNVSTIKAAGNYQTDDDAINAVKSIKTWDDLKAFYEGTGSYEGHKIPTEYALFNGMGDGGYLGWYSQCFIAAGGGKFLDSKTNTVLPNEDGSITNALNMMKYMYDYSPKSIRNSSTAFTGTSNDPAGKVLFQLADGSAIDKLNVTYTTFGAINFPGMTKEIGSASNIGGENLAIPRTSKNKDGAVALAQYLVSEKCMSFIQTCTNNFAAVKKYATIETFSNDESSSVYAMYSVLKDQLMTAQVRPVVKGWMQVNDNALPTNLTKFIEGDVTVDQAISSIREYAKSYLEF